MVFLSLVDPTPNAVDPPEKTFTDFVGLSPSPIIPENLNPLESVLTTLDLKLGLLKNIR